MQYDFSIFCLDKSLYTIILFMYSYKNYVIHLEFKLGSSYKYTHTTLPLYSMLQVISTLQLAKYIDRFSVLTHSGV